MKPPIKPAFLKLKDDARYVGYGDSRSLLEAIGRGDLPAYRPVPRGRYLVSVDDLDAWVKDHQYRKPMALDEPLRGIRFVT